MDNVRRKVFQQIAIPKRMKKNLLLKQVGISIYFAFILSAAP